MTKEAVACVILHRAARPGWWGTDIVSVCLKPWQFSCWNANDPNRPKLLAVTEADPAFAECLAVADEAIAGTITDLTRGADSYFDTSIPAPSWAQGRVPTLVLGKMRFYRVAT